MQTDTLLRRRPVVAFYLLAFGFSWLGWLPQALHARGLFPWDSPLFSFLGSGGPTLAAVVVALALREQDGVGALFRPLWRLRAAPRWFLFAFGFWFVAAAVALGMGALLGQGFPAVGQFPWVSLLPVLIGMLLSNVWEEIGWRGFALPRLQERYPDGQIVLLMGLLWIFWHLPLLLNPTSPMAALPWYGEVVFSLSLTVIYTWLYRNTGRSLFFVTIFHAMSNTVAWALLELGVFVSSYPAVVGFTTLVALGIVLVYGVQRFERAGAPNRPQAAL